MELTAIPGVGEKTAAALSTLDDPEGAIESGDVAAIATAPGVTPARAARIARAAIKARHDDEGAFLATSRARSIYQDVLALLQREAETAFAKRRLETLYPSTTMSRIEEIRELSTRALERDLGDDVAAPLGKVAPLASPTGLRIRDRCLATGDEARYEAASEQYPELSVELVENARGISDLAKGYAAVIVLDETFAGLDLPDNVEVLPDALEDPVRVAPERIIGFYAENREPITAAIEVARRAGLSVEVDLDELEAKLSRIGEDGRPVGDEERDRLRRALDDFDVSLEMAASTANDHLRAAITEQDVTVEGTDLLSLVEQGAGVDALFHQQLADEYDEAITRAEDYLVDALELTPSEATDVERLFPTEPTFPISTVDGPAERLRGHLREAHDRRASELTRSLAEDLRAHREEVEDLVARALELDVERAIARFARSFDCVMPTFADSGLAIEGGRSPLLDLPPDEVEPVDYEVAGVVLLSGVNSGGKTSLLDLVAATVILAHMGLPVPADRVRLQRFDALHYHAATQGTLDAGAFEATVQQFAELATGEGDRLVLVDELESITEPGAAAIIVSGILEELAEETTAIFVSHLAAEIQEVADVDIRVDGIRASGVENGELVVDRTPIRDHLARSTPELIVEQLAETGDGAEAAVYERLLEKFD